MNSLIVSEFEKIIEIHVKVIKYLTDTYGVTKDINKSLEISKLSYKLHGLRKSIKIIKEYQAIINTVDDIKRINGITPNTINYMNQIITNGKIINTGINQEFIDYFNPEKPIENNNLEEPSNKDATEKVESILTQPLYDQIIQESVKVDDDMTPFFGGCINNPFLNMTSIIDSMLKFF